MDSGDNRLIIIRIALRVTIFAIKMLIAIIIMIAGTEAEKARIGFRPTYMARDTQDVKGLPLRRGTWSKLRSRWTRVIPLDDLG